MQSTAQAVFSFAGRNTQPDIRAFVLSCCESFASFSGFRKSLCFLTALGLNIPREVINMADTAMKGSRTYPTAVLLTFMGGFLDAYTYFERGGVFANAQTGNIIKLGLNIAAGEFLLCVRYLIPILAFVLGILAVMYIEGWMDRHNGKWKRRMVLAVECVCFVLVALIPQREETDIIANTLVSFACAMQMGGFKQFVGQAIATTVSTGNLRKAVEFLYTALSRHDREHLLISLQYTGIVFIFIFGVIAGARASVYLHTFSILIPALICVAAILMITKYNKDRGII